jgi:hypothetical protein
MSDRAACTVVGRVALDRVDGVVGAQRGDDDRVLASDRGAACLAHEARRRAALVIRLAHRALEVHARDVGYEFNAWRERAVLEADAALTAAWVGDCDDELGLATAAVLDATFPSPRR